MSVIQSASAPPKSGAETALPLEISASTAEEERLWEEEFRENREFYVALLDEALEDYRQGRTEPLEEFLAEEHPLHSKNDWLTTVGKYPADAPLNRMLDAGAKIRAAASGE